MSASHSKVTRFAHKSRKFISWGGPSWQAAFGVIGPAWAVHLMEESIDAETQALVTEILAKEADNLDKPIPTARTGDTASPTARTFWERARGTAPFPSRPTSPSHS